MQRSHDTSLRLLSPCRAHLRIEDEIGEVIYNDLVVKNEMVRIADNICDEFFNSSDNPNNFVNSNRMPEEGLSYTISLKCSDNGGDLKRTPFGFAFDPVKFFQFFYTDPETGVTENLSGQENFLGSLKFLLSCR